MNIFRTDNDAGFIPYFHFSRILDNDFRLTDTDVTVEVGLKDIEINDVNTGEDEGGAVGNIVSIIYKGDHYQIIVRTDENEEDFVCDTEYTWNENDRVSVSIPASKIKISLKQEVKR